MNRSVIALMNMNPFIRSWRFTSESVFGGHFPFHALFFFFFQAEDGIRDWSVTGVQTCALPISVVTRGTRSHRPYRPTPQLLPREETRWAPDDVLSPQTVRPLRPFPIASSRIPTVRAKCPFDWHAGFQQRLEGHGSSGTSWLHQH